MAAIRLRFSLLVLLTALGVSRPARSQAVLWTRMVGSPEIQRGFGVAVDPDKNVYVVGDTQGSFDGNAFSGVEDILLVKYDAAGRKLWTRFVGSKGNDVGVKVAVDRSKNVYLAGIFNDTLDGQRTQGGFDMCLIKFDPGGKKLWMRTSGSKETDSVTGLAIGPSGKIYVSGYSRGTFEGQVRAGKDDVFIFKYGPDGDRIWSRYFGTPEDDPTRDMAVDADENIYVAGFTEGSIDGQKNAGSYDVFVLKYDSAGTKQWARQWGGPENDQASAITADALGNVYVTGSSMGGSSALVLTKYDNKGTRLWTGRTHSVSVNASGEGVAVDGSGNPYLAGRFQGPLDGQRGPGNEDICLIKYNRDGRKLSMKLWGTVPNDWVNGMAIDADGLIYLVGYTDGDLGGNKNLGTDVFLMKVTPHVPSFDCSKARTIQETLICESANLSGLDSAIAQLYSARLRSSSTPAKVKAEQIRWVKAERNACVDRDQLAKTMQQRIDALKAMP